MIHTLSHIKSTSIRSSLPKVGTCGFIIMYLSFNYAKFHVSSQNLRMLMALMIMVYRVDDHYHIRKSFNDDSDHYLVLVGCCWLLLM